MFENQTPLHDFRSISSRIKVSIPSLSIYKRAQSKCRVLENYSGAQTTQKSDTIQMFLIILQRPSFFSPLCFPYSPIFHKPFTNSCLAFVQGIPQKPNKNLFKHSKTSSSLSSLSFYATEAQTAEPHSTKSFQHPLNEKSWKNASNLNN